MAKASQNKDKEYSLLHPKAMGGIHGGEGYTFQDRYIVCHIPKWLSNEDFVRLMPEATGDVDVIYKDGRKHVYEHIQVKDHPVDLSEFKKVLEDFVKIDSDIKRTYRKFTLTAPSIHPQVKSLKKSLQRYKEGKKFFGSAKHRALKTTEHELKGLLEKLGIKNRFRFLTDKLEIEIGGFNFDDNSVCKSMFVATLAQHPKYREHLFDLLSPAYSSLIEQVLAHRGKVLNNTNLYEFINKALIQRAKSDKANVLHFHNWGVEKYEPEATIELDWSPFFDRQTRRVPDVATWNKELLPKLYEVRESLAKKTADRHILFRGKCALSTAIILGAAFPEIGNWTFELFQPPQVVPWKSDAEKIKSFKPKYEIIEPGSVGLTEGKDNVFVFNITGKALDEVVHYFQTNSLPVNKIIAVQPSSQPGTSSIQNDSEAVSLASVSKDILKQMLVKYKAEKTHLFYYGPVGLALFLGQKLSSVGSIQLYEYQNPGYVPSCLIKT